MRLVSLPFELVRELVSHTLLVPRLFSLNLVQVGQPGFVEEVCLTVLLLARLVNFRHARSWHKKPYGLYFK
jgi:hypothetical protein